MVAPPASSLRDVDVSSYQANGFLGVRDFLTPVEAARLGTIVRGLLDRNAGRRYGDQFDLAGPDERADDVNVSQLLHPSRYAPELFELFVRTRGHAIARQLLGSEAVFDFDHALYKRPFNDVPTPWHQDEAYWNGRYDHEALTIWIPLQDVAANGGCLEFVPGSHLGDVRRHRPLRGDPRMHALECLDVDDRYRVVFPLPLGAATIHHCRVVHYSGPNATAVPRYVYVMCFRAARRLRSDADHAWAGNRITASGARLVASRTGRGSLINRGLRRASVVLQWLNEWNERRTLPPV